MDDIVVGLDAGADDYVTKPFSTRERLIEKIWGLDYEGDANTLVVHVGRLRRKLGGTGECIETLVGVGYRFTGFRAPVEKTLLAKATAM